MTRTPASLLEQLRSPDQPEAWARFVSLYAPLIYSWGRRVGLQEGDAEDLVQEVLLTLVQALPTFQYDRRQSFRRWLRTITLNKWRDRQKRRAEQLVPPGAGPLDAVPDPDQEAFWEQEYRQYLVRRALAVMQADFQPTTWKACWEHVVSGRAAADVGAELGLSVGAVYAAKFRVLDRLRQELEGLLE
jgi:RNA polymerase sigma-70 factor (ECF subfamily)